MYAEALVAIYRFLPEEDALALFTICAEPDRSDAVKTCVVRACLTLALEAGRIKWQKPLGKLEDAMRLRFRDIFKSAGLRHPEVDQYGNMKRAATRPKAAQAVAQPLSDREVLMLGLLSVWRTPFVFHFKDMAVQEVEEWIVIVDMMWEGPIDNCVKMSGSSTFAVVAENVFSALSADPLQKPEMFNFVKSAL